ncbi:hypothetical protein BGP_0597 [Beggiatoa sp. PS]|nr:hypothetical protein BGP_0597 [Beggiatoa sp. PS]
MTKFEYLLSLITLFQRYSFILASFDEYTNILTKANSNAINYFDGNRDSNNYLEKKKPLDINMPRGFFKLSTTKRSNEAKRYHLKSTQRIIKPKACSSNSLFVFQICCTQFLNKITRIKGLTGSMPS